MTEIHKSESGSQLSQAPQSNNDVAQVNQGTLTLDVKNIPNLHNAEESGVDLSSEYWTPENEGESKVGIPVKIEDAVYEDQETGEHVVLPCLIFVEQTKEGLLRTVRNGSKRLVATIENAVEAGHIQLGRTPIKIVFNGKQKNTTNSFKSDRWSIKPLLIKHQ